MWGSLGFEPRGALEASGGPRPRCVGASGSRTGRVCVFAFCCGDVTTTGHPGAREARLRRTRLMLPHGGCGHHQGNLNTKFTGSEMNREGLEARASDPRGGVRPRGCGRTTDRRL